MFIDVVKKTHKKQNQVMIGENSYARFFLNYQNHECKQYKILRLTDHYKDLVPDEITEKLQLKIS